MWQTECIARIDPKTGLIRGWVLLSGLLDAARRAGKGRHIDVLNGEPFAALIMMSPAIRLTLRRQQSA